MSGYVTILANHLERSPFSDRDRNGGDYPAGGVAYFGSACSIGVFKGGAGQQTSQCRVVRMEMPMQGKTTSDFSIERILSEEPCNPRPEAPGWLCCTRYRPPRLPRAVSANRARRAGKHARVPFTAAQARALESAYARAPYLAPPALRALAAALQLRDDRIKIWFQNRRARERREKCSTIAPPHGITLTPTCFPVQSSLLATRIDESFSQDESLSQSLGDHGEIDRRYTQEARSSALYVYDEGNRLGDIPADAERPDTPLDIESVED